MLDDLSQRQKRIVSAAVACLVLAGVAALVWLATGDDGAQLDSADGATERLAPDWSDNGPRTVELTFDGDDGPTWRLAEDRSVPITPLPPEADLGWELRRTGGAIVVEGTGTWSGADVTARWRFERGDPQARFAVRVADIPLADLRDRDWSATIALPPGDLRVSDGSLGLAGGDDLESPHRISPWEPAWLRWQRESRRFSLLDWTGDGLTVRPAGDGTDIDVHLWRHDVHSSLQNCETDDESPPTLDLSGSAIFQFGAAPTVFPARSASSNEASVAPIFDLPNAHPDSTLHRGHPDDPDEWAARARTLAYGHSNSDDPRYGNGGLLGHGLGGTIVVPSIWWKADPVAAFRRDIRGTHLAVAHRGELPESQTDDTTALGEAFSCSSILRTDENGSRSVVDKFVPFRGELKSAVRSSPVDADPTISSPSTDLAAGVRPLRLDGTRPELTDEALADESLNMLLHTRGLTTFATPLIGSRNPLIPAAREALLSPEREGEWTLTSSFAETLAQLEITAEMQPLAVRSLSELIRYWRRARRVTRRWNEVGELLIRSDPAVAGYTLVVDGADIDPTEITVDGADDVQVRHSRDDTGPGEPSPQTWISWDLDAETTYRVGFGDATSEVANVESVTWEIDE